MTDVHELLDDGFAPPSCDVLLVGCGNILRGDDAVGPRLVRLLWDEGVPPGVRLVDGGTAGMDVAFQMRGAARVVIVDAAATGGAAGTIYRVPAEELAQLPPASGIHTHSFRWDHAIAFSRWLLGPAAPADVTVFLIEAGGLRPGDDLSPAVAGAMGKVAAAVREEFFPSADGDEMIEVTGGGYLHLSGALAEKYFPAGVVGSRFDGRTLHLVPVCGPASGHHLLRQANAGGDRALLLRELLDHGPGSPRGLDADPVPGLYKVVWDHTRGALSVDLLTPG